ncbi:helix-turn-helix transcriptional regulator [Methylicorpusculum sp.]|uniref:helix-turn-helix transcriptional regulator n=1 Tax=Methylicorpusculum sp. TaxID=2713644 RepID=UPI002ABB8F12|nr:AlpA family phage regulatory protein [Methylicorpusculum sp.]MDZ4153742.1 AlpA family phage regulatory protein [Methylicorpusculum sp.]
MATATKTNPKTSNQDDSISGTGGAGYMRLPELRKLIPFSRSTFWRKVKQGTFPKPFKLSENISAWKVEDVNEWMNNRNHKDGKK